MKMFSLEVGRSVMALVVACSVLGIPIQVSAAGERNGRVTVDRRPLVGPVSLTTGTTERPMDPHLARSGSARPADGLVKPGEVDRRLTRAIRLTRSQPATTPKRSWVKRHPALFGTLVGAVAGAGIVQARVGAEAAFVGFYGGAAGGSLVGWLVGR